MEKQNPPSRYSKFLDEGFFALIEISISLKY